MFWIGVYCMSVVLKWNDKGLVVKWLFLFELMKKLYIEVLVFVGKF